VTLDTSLLEVIYRHQYSYVSISKRNLFGVPSFTSAKDMIGGKKFQKRVTFAISSPDEFLSYYPSIVGYPDL